MSILSRNLYSQINFKLHDHSPKFHLKSPNLSLYLHPKPFINPSILQSQKSHFPNFRCAVQNSDKWAVDLNSLEHEGVIGRGRASSGDFNFDAFLSVLEFICLASSFLASVLYAVNSGLLGSPKVVFGWFSNRLLVWQFVVLVGGVVVGAIIRSRQWRRICNADFTRPVNLAERIEKLEEDLKSSTTIIRALSRHLEKLGVRFRVTRKALKEPISQAAALAQKNSEATRMLAMQEDILEKELAEIQKVLLAMQEQQQKQLELILAIATSRKLREGKREQNLNQNVTEASAQPVDRSPVLEPNQIEALAGKREANTE